MKLNEHRNRSSGILTAAFTVIFLASAGHSLAQSPYFQTSTTSGRYRAKEASMDFFASYLKSEHGLSHVFDNGLSGGSMGGGLGMNYFFSQDVGMGTDLNIPNNGGAFVDSYTVNIIYRLPLGSSGLAPYFSGGGGRSYDPSTQWIGQAAVGLEYRSDSKAGLFVDARYVWGEKHSSDNLLLRAGLRMVF